MLAIRSRTQLFSAPSLQSTRPARCSVQVQADGGFEQQVQKLKEDVNLPVPLEYAYAGTAWGAPAGVLRERDREHGSLDRQSNAVGLTLLTWGSPLSFIGKLVIFLHFLAAATNVARLGAIARPDQASGESAAAKALGTGLLFGPFGVKPAQVQEK